MMLLYDSCQGERHACLLEGCVREQGKPGIEAIVLNISESGCRLDSRAELEEGTRVWVRLPGLEPWEARVVWTRGGSAGCRFAQPLHPAVVQRLIGARLPRNPRGPA
jgi:hypothetical protein